MLNSFAEVEVGSLKSEIDRYRFELSRQATAMWPGFESAIDKAAVSLPEAVRPPDGVAQSEEGDLGTFIVNNTAADDLDDENFDAIVGALQEFDEPYQEVSPRDIPNYMPMQRNRATRAIYIPGEGWYNPRRVVSHLEAVLAHHPQVTLIDASVDRLVMAGGGISHAVLDNGETVAGDMFLLATGATASDVLARSDLGLAMQRVFYGVGVSIEIKSRDYPHSKCIRTPNRGLACGVYSAPYFQGQGLANDHVLIGASNFISPTPYHHGRLTSVETLMRSAIEQINENFYRADLIRVNIGWRPTSTDTYPLIGTSSISNLVIATGTKRDGFHLAPVLSEKIAAMLHGRHVEQQFACFAPERVPIRSLTRDEAIEKAVRHQVSASYQHGFSPSTSRMPDQIRKMYRQQVSELHDEVGAQDWGIPPEMIDMYRYGHISR